MGKYHVHRSDGNAKAIIDAIRKAGASVEIIHQPLDVLIGAHGLTVVAEIKTARGRLEASQKVFLDGWRGAACVLRSVEDGLNLLDSLRIMKGYMVAGAKEKIRCAS